MNAPRNHLRVKVTEVMLLLRLDRKSNVLRPMERRSLSDARIMERYDLQRLICAGPDLFFGELGEELLLLGQEVQPADLVDNRIDVLALDKQGAVVVIELKRGHNPYQLLQGLSYAAMLADWQPEELLEVYRTTAGKSVDDAEAIVEQFLDVEISQLNQKQRLVLVAEEFDYEVLATARWLGQSGSVDVRCYRLVLSADEASEVLSCSCVYPIAELEEHARRRGRGGDSPPQWADWDAALAGVRNAAVREFFLSEVTAGQEANLRGRTISYRIDGKRRFFASVKKDWAYVWQKGRFSDDEQFWRDRLSAEAAPEEVDVGTSLRFRLFSMDDFAAFRKAIKGELVKAVFAESADDFPATEPPPDSPQSP